MSQPNEEWAAPLKPRLIRPSPNGENLRGTASPQRVESLSLDRWRYSENVAPLGLWLPHEPDTSRPAPQPIWSILIATGDPSANGNRFDREVTFIREVIGDTPWTERSSVSVGTLTTLLRQDLPTVLHICAHTDQEQVALQTGGEINWVPFDLFSEALLTVPNGPRLLVLNMCNCPALATLLGGWATTILYWAEAIDDDAARSFSGAFYRELLDGVSVHAAATSASADTPQLLGQHPQILGNPDLVLVPRARPR